MVKISFSQLAIIISFCVIGYLTLSNKYWRPDNMVIENDIISYYAYLPSIFIYEDPSLMFLDKESTSSEVRIWYETTDEDKRVIKTTMGVSYFYLPFFILAHQIATITDFNANGYSMPYRMAIVLSSFFFFILALLYLRKYLLFFFNEKTIFWTLLIVGIGTNIVNYVIKESGMSHVYSFFLISAFLYYTHKWYKETCLKDALVVGLLIGLITLVRPTNLLVIVIFVFYGIGTFTSIKERFNLFFKLYKHLILAIIISLLVVFPQLLYWKYNSGNWFFYSYSNERFFFSDPMILKGLFSYRKGWLLYTPLMSFAFIGFLFKNKNVNNLKIIFFIFTVIYIYITFSWWSWWYGGSFGMRSMIDIYPILSVPIAILIEKLYNRRLPVKFITSSILIALIALNLFQNYQYRIGMIHYDAMTKESYWMIWGKTGLMDGYWESLDPTDSEAAKRGERDI